MQVKYKITINRLHHYERGLDFLERIIGLCLKKEPYARSMSVSASRQDGMLVIEASGREFMLERSLEALLGYESLSLYAGPVIVKKIKEDQQEKKPFNNVWGGPY